MVRQLSEVRLEVRGVEILESLSDLPMELQAATPRRTVVGGISDQRVGEPHSTDGVGNLGDDARVDPLVEQSGGRPRVRAG